MIKNKLFIAFIIIPLSFATGCSHGTKEKIECDVSPLRSRTLDVKPLYQTAFGCGPAALTMVLNYHGTNVSLEKTTAVLFNTSLKGTLITDMKAYASRYFSSSRIEKSNICDVLIAISKGNPVILFLDLGSSIISSPHYIVAVGYDMDAQTLVFHNGYAEFSKALFGVINEKWEKTGSLALFIDRN